LCIGKPKEGTMHLPIAMALLLASMPAMAGSQSSDSSSNCSNGRCTRVDRLVIEDDRGRRGFVRSERWREEGAFRALPRAELRIVLPGGLLLVPPRGWRVDDDDDD
jgi:hypothetical protein